MKIQYRQIAFWTKTRALTEWCHYTWNPRHRLLAALDYRERTHG